MRHAARLTGKSGWSCDVTDASPASWMGGLAALTVLAQRRRRPRARVSIETAALAYPNVVRPMRKP